MLFKSLATIAAASAALAAPIESAQAQDTYTLNAAVGPGATNLQGLQIHGVTIVIGLTQGYSYFKAEAQDNGTVKVVADGFPTLGLEVAPNGELTINANPNPNGGWEFKGDGSVKDLEYNGIREFYSCISPTDPLHGGNLVYVKNTDDYACEDPQKFTIAATKE